MIKINKRNSLEYISEYIPEISARIMKFPLSVQMRVQEIRLREGQFVTLELCNPQDRVRLDVKITAADMEEYLRRVCRYSIHSYAAQLSEGYVTISGGHRVGFCGSAIISNGRVQGIREITSMNFRVAKEFPGCSDLLFEVLRERFAEIKGVLIIGRPLSAKTTVLRDLIRSISENKKVAVVDERGEIAAKSDGRISFDLGPNTDVLDSFPKGDGFITALRALSPDFISCDEIGFDYDEIALCVNSGVRLLLTAHCSGLQELKHSRLSDIIQTGGISHIALLGDGTDIGRLKGFWEVTVANEHIEYTECDIGYPACVGRGAV